MGKLFQYLLISALLLVVAYVTVKPAVDATAASLNRSGEMISNRGRNF